MRRSPGSVAASWLSHVVVMIGRMTNTAVRPEIQGAGIGGGSSTGRTVRRVVRCGGVRGVLVRRGGVWSVGNTDELRVLAALGGDGSALGRLEALAATLNAGLVDPGGLRALSRTLDQIGDTDRRRPVWACDEMLPAAGFACALLGVQGGTRWLGWALAARLDGNLLRGCLPGPGLLAFEDCRDRRGRLYAGGYSRDIRWLTAMPSQFWGLLERCEWCEPAGEAFCAASGPAASSCLRALRAASDPAAKPAVLKALAATRDKTVLDLVASHPNTPAKALLEVARSPWSGDYVRWRVAQNKQASPWLLQRLAKHHFPVLRGVAAAHPNMPQRSLQRLAGDEDSFVRARAALHPEAPAGMLSGLARDPDSGVRANAASHRSCPPDALERLLGDRIGRVRAAAVSNPLVSPQRAAAMARDRVIAVRAAVGWRSDTAADILGVLAGDDKWQVRLAAAWNRNTPPRTLAALARDPIQQVRNRASANPSQMGGALAELADDGDFWVRASVAANPALPPGVAAVLASDRDPHVRYCLASNERLSPAALQRLAGDEVWYVRRAAAGNLATPEAALDALAGDHDAEVRAAAASHPNTPREALRRLARDGDYRARFEADQNLNKRTANRHKEEREEGEQR